MKNNHIDIKLLMYLFDLLWKNYKYYCVEFQFWMLMSPNVLDEMIDGMRCMCIVQTYTNHQRLSSFYDMHGEHFDVVFYNS